MSKQETIKEEKNAFGAFNILKGKFETPEGEQEDPIDDITTGSEDIIEDKDNLDKEAERLKAGDKELEKVIKAKEKLTEKSKSSSKSKTTEDVEDSDNEEDTSNEDEDAEEISAIKIFAKSLYEKGVLDFNDEDEDFEPSEEGLNTLQNKTIQNRINKWVESKNPDFIKFMEFTDNGGNPEEFLNVYYGSNSWENFKVDSEEAQKKAIRESLKLAGEAEEDIEELVTEWVDNGTIEKRANTALNKLKKYEATEKENIVQRQRLEAERRKSEELAYLEDFKKDLYSRDNVMGFKLTPKLKDKIWESLTVVKRNGKTAYQESVESKRETTLLFALQAVNDFDISKLETQVKTKVNKELGAVLKNYTKTSKEKISSGRTDDNYDTDPFAGFKTAK